MKVPTKFEVDDLLPSYSVIAADTLRDLVTLTFDPLVVDYSVRRFFIFVMCILLHTCDT